MTALQSIRLEVALDMHMYHRILLPIDGSMRSFNGAEIGMRFARAVGAAVVGIYVAQLFRPEMYVDMFIPDTRSEQSYLKTIQVNGERCMATLEINAARVSVPFRGIVKFSDNIADEIVAAAREHECDLIAMSSHGRSGWRLEALGSVASKVIALSELPVLVHGPKLPIIEQEQTPSRTHL